MNCNKILIANTGEDSLTTIDLKNGFEIKTIFLSELIQKCEYTPVEERGQLRPVDIEKTEDGYILVTNSYDDSIMKIDIVNMNILGFVKVGKNPTVIKEFQGKTYVVNTDSNSISVMNTDTFTLIEDISVGEKPTDLKIDTKKQKCFVANSNCYSINVLDIVDEKIESIILGKQPIKMILEGEKIFILSYINNGTMNVSNITELSTEDYEIKKSIDLKGIFDDFIKIKEHEIFYLSSADDGYVYRITLDRNANITKIYLGGMPGTIKWDGETKLYIANILNDEISIVDILTNQVIKNLRVGKEPGGILLL